MTAVAITESATIDSHGFMLRISKVSRVSLSTAGSDTLDPGKRWAATRKSTIMPLERRDGGSRLPVHHETVIHGKSGGFRLCHEAPGGTSCSRR
jgi:hypothetical protein